MVRGENFYLNLNHVPRQIKKLQLLKLVLTKSRINMSEEILGQIQLCQFETGTESAVSQLRDLVSTQVESLHLIVFQLGDLGQSVTGELQLSQAAHDVRFNVRQSLHFVI